MQKFKVRLATPAHEMAREEILKQAAFLSKDIANVEFSGDGQEIVFSAPPDRGAELINSVRSLANRIQRALRSLQRKVVFRSAEMDSLSFAENGHLADVHFLGTARWRWKALPWPCFATSTGYSRASGIRFGQRH